MFLEEEGRKKGCLKKLFLEGQKKSAKKETIADEEIRWVEGRKKKKEENEFHSIFIALLL